MFSRDDIFDSTPLQALADRLGGLSAAAPVRLRGVHGSLMAFVASSVFERRKTQTVVIVPEQGDAEQLRDDCALLLGESQVRLAIAGPSHSAKLLDMSGPIAHVEALRSLARGERVLTVVSAESLASLVPPPAQLEARSIDLVRGSEYPFEELLVKLESLGFQRVEFVGEYGDMAVRGGIVDIFPFIGDNPIRFEFWGDTLESIREFEVLSQRSIQDLDKAGIVAQLTPNARGDGTAVTLLGYCPADATILLQEPALIQREIEELLREEWPNVASWETVEVALTAFARVEHSNLFDSRTLGLIDAQSSPQPAANGSVRRFAVHLSDLGVRQYRVFIACDTPDESRRLKDLLEEEITSPEPGRERALDDTFSSGERPATALAALPAYEFLFEAFHSGFVLPAARLALFTEHEIFGRLKRRGTAKRRRFKGISQKELQQLRRGDYVVHADHGIGKFAGLQKLRVRGAEQEVMKLLYLDNDVLYVNLNFVNRVQKYSSQEGHVPTLHKLGGADWDRLKAKARKKIKDIARDLITLYARRTHETGMAFAPDTHWQKEMEASFLYEDTPDQAKATTDVKQDMERSSPMDRLICGDVGFGKTEVAVRAAFKAVMNGKQVAVLVPTTILASQHYNTFLDRLGRYSVRIESLTRFRGTKDLKAVVEGMKEGRVDVAIGTHRLLSKDVGFKDLGLLVIDEEQRFGVTAKEKLRQLRATVDTLTLTATPIPRTLQFSLMGARDLSLINTPPRNRLPIITEIAQFDLQLIREAILKELHRGGQVFFVHDRIQNIDEIRAMLEEHVPEARFHVAHGQMKGHELERTMLDFLERKFDVLLCTKIIESGIDIPSVNTMIINRADRFGLAELYQLRGRVGRSNVQAFAYLLTPPLSVLPKHTLRRLQAIQEFTELGSGFNLAMRDLEIRGAGNLLGGEQSGFILEMGFDMYQKVVEEAVRELKEQEFADVFAPTGGEERVRSETVIESDIEALIPEIYVESDAERLDLYRRMYRAATVEELETLGTELTDRFGPYPQEVAALFKLVELKILAAETGFTRVDISSADVQLTFPPPEEHAFYESVGQLQAPFQRIVETFTGLRSFQPRLKQDGTQLRLQIRIPAVETDERLVQLAGFLRSIR